MICSFKETHRIEAIHQSWCNKNGITIYPIPIAYSKGFYKIAVKTTTKGEKIGNERYPTTTNKQQIGYTEKIRELYKYFYTKNTAIIGLYSVSSSFY